MSFQFKKGKSSLITELSAPTRANKLLICPNSINNAIVFAKTSAQNGSHSQQCLTRLYTRVQVGRDDFSLDRRGTKRLTPFQDLFPRSYLRKRHFFSSSLVRSATVLGRNRKWATYTHAKICIGVIVVFVIIACVPLYLSYEVTRLVFVLRQLSFDCLCVCMFVCYLFVRTKNKSQSSSIIS